MRTRSIYLFMVVLIAAAQFFVSNELLKGYLRSPDYLAKELKSSPDSIYQYRLSDEAPFKYRLLFSTVVKSTSTIVNADQNSQEFYLVYKFWSCVFYVSSALSFYWLMLQSGFSAAFSFSGAMIFLLLPPMLMAFTLPVHSREDMLAYTLLFAGLAFMLKGDRIFFLLVSILGVFTRETLLLLPMVYLLFVRDEKLAKRILVAVIPVVIWVAIRLAMGPEQYEVWEGLHWNLNNPVQVVGFLFITFNFLWLSFLLHFRFFKDNMHFIGSDLRFFYRSSLVVFIVIVVTTFLGGIFNEVRLLYLYAPWMIVLFLDCFRNYRSYFVATMQTTRYWIFVVLCLITCSVLLFVVLSNRETLIVPGKYAVPYDQWIIFSVCYIFIMLISIPHMFKIYALKKSLK